MRQASRDGFLVTGLATPRTHIHTYMLYVRMYVRDETK